MIRNVKEWRKTRTEDHLQTEVNRIHRQTTKAHQKALYPLQLTGLEASRWRMLRWPNALPPKPKWRSTSVRMKRKPMIRRRHEHSVPFCLHSSRHGCRTTSWCWLTLFVRTVFHKLFGHLGIGCVMSIAQSTPCVMPYATKPLEPPSGIFWCASGTKRRTSLNFRRGRISRSLEPQTRPTCYDVFDSLAISEMKYRFLKMGW